MENLKCDICNKEIVVEYEDDIRSDDSGDYHTECLDEYWRKEMAYYLGTWKAHRAEQEERALYADAYEWNDPKNPEYLDYVLERADDVRKEKM